jgi:hypothetical protein
VLQQVSKERVAKKLEPSPIRGHISKDPGRGSDVIAADACYQDPSAHLARQL